MRNKKKTENEETSEPAITSNALAGEFDMPIRTIQSILSEAGAMNKRGAGYDAIRSYQALAKYFQRKANTLNDPGEVTRERKRVAEADMAEVELAHKIGTLCDKSAFKLAVQSLGVEIREIVRKFKPLNPAQAAELCKQFSTIKPRIEA